MAVLLPKTLAELHTHLAAVPNARIMAGGTDLLVRLRSEKTPPGDVVCIENIPELRAITFTGTTLRISAGATITALIGNDLIRAKLPLLHQTCTTFASPLIRNMATIGGNICTASPAGDTLPALYVMEASVELISTQGMRTLSLNEFIKGPGRTDLRQNEILAAVNVPVPEGFDLQYFEKVGQREALAIAVVSMAGLVALKGGVVSQARFAWGSVGSTIIRSTDVEKSLIGKKLTLTALRETADIVRETIAPISDVRASADYRRQVAGNLLLRLAAL